MISKQNTSAFSPSDSFADIINIVNAHVLTVWVTSGHACHDVPNKVLGDPYCVLSVSLFYFAGYRSLVSSLHASVTDYRRLGPLASCLSFDSSELYITYMR